MMTDLSKQRPASVQRRFPNSKVPLVNGQVLFQAAKKANAMVMAVNIRCRLPVEGVIRASMAAEAPVL